MNARLSDGPFVLLDDARSEGARPARLYRDPVEQVVARTVAEVEPALERLRAATRDGLHAAGFLSYEAGFALELRLIRFARDVAADAPLLWFGLFQGVERVAADAVPDLLPAPDDEAIGAAKPVWTREEYRAAFNRLQDYIQAGDLYQANLTFPCEVDLTGDPRAAYAAVRARAAGGHGALVDTGEAWLLSFSPELFFTLRSGALTARPMKGTAVRGASAAEDAALIRELRTDPKQRAENLMIVDLLRNDLSRVAQAGSVRVPELFVVESYPTVHQMISTVEGQVQPGLDAVDVLRALYPCGSITGAPKLRAMEIIHELEAGPRGIYTGAIGYLSPDGDAAFNVAIRSVYAQKGAKSGRIGLGSGVVADSRADAEWDECLDKGRFLRA